MLTTRRPRDPGAGTRCRHPSPGSSRGEEKLKPQVWTHHRGAEGDSLRVLRWINYRGYLSIRTGVGRTVLPSASSPMCPHSHGGLQRLLSVCVCVGGYTSPSWEVMSWVWSAVKKRAVQIWIPRF